MILKQNLAEVDVEEIISTHGGETAMAVVELFGDWGMVNKIHDLATNVHDITHLTKPDPADLPALTEWCSQLEASFPGGMAEAVSCAYPYRSLSV